MFAIECPQHRARVLVGPSGIDAIYNVEEIILVDFRCTCGWRGSLVTGRHVATPYVLPRERPQDPTATREPTHPTP